MEGQFQPLRVELEKQIEEEFQQSIQDQLQGESQISSHPSKYSKPRKQPTDLVTDSLHTDPSQDFHEESSISEQPGDQAEPSVEDGSPRYYEYKEEPKQILKPQPVMHRAG